jgi:two-component system response regulator NreC
MSVNVVVAVRHPIMRRGVCAVLEDSAVLNVVGDVGDLSALEEACSRLRPGIALVDNSLVKLQRGSSIQTLMRRHQYCRFVLLSLYERPKEARQNTLSFDLGGDSTEPESARISVANALAELPLQKMKPGSDNINEPLTARENEVLQNIAQGYTNAEIASRLEISIRTAELHRYRIYRKLGVSSPLDLAKFLIRQGMVPM